MNMFEQEPNSPELFFGLVGAAGCDLDEVAGQLTSTLNYFKYTSTIIKMSKVLSEIPRYANLNSLSSESQFIRINNFMDAGDDLREKIKLGDALALCAIPRIHQVRENKSGNPKVPNQRHAYIFNSLKQPAEIVTLKKIYGDAFLLISVYSPKAKMIEFLKQKIRASEQIPEASDLQKKSEFLLTKDSRSGKKDYGQNVSEAFPMGDIFINISDIKFPQEIHRFLSIWFGTKLHTPRKDESGMYFAKAASLRSSDLSRQVGAAIATQDGEVVVTGCNEVPSPDGGTIWEEDNIQDRDFEIGYDSNTSMKYEIIKEVIGKFKDHDWLAAEQKEKQTTELVREIISGRLKSSFENARITSLIEFGRIIHAEMSAIVGAARKGISINSTTLYCTTFPCHMCARHIIGAGIRRVVYIEPYPKSLAKKLYNKSIKTDSSEHDTLPNAVKFEPFVGISPTIYQGFFQMRKRKDDTGNFKLPRPEDASPRIQQSPVKYLDHEEIAFKFIELHDKLLFGTNGEALESAWENREESKYAFK